MTLRFGRIYTPHVPIPAPRRPSMYRAFNLRDIDHEHTPIMVRRLVVQLPYYPMFCRRLPRERQGVILRAPTPSSVGLPCPTIILRKYGLTSRLRPSCRYTRSLFRNICRCLHITLFRSLGVRSTLALFNMKYSPLLLFAAGARAGTTIWSGSFNAYSTVADFDNCARFL